MADRQWRFPYKLYRLLTHGQSGNAVQWNTEGTGIKLQLQALHELLSTTGSHPFKTQSVKSFIRQLHLYGFRRMSIKKRQKRDPLLSHDDNSSNEGAEAALEFCHPYFRRANPDFVDYVRRRTASKKKSGHINTTSKENAGKRKFLSSQDSQESFSSQSQGQASTFVEEQVYKTEINSISASQSESHNSFYSGNDQNALSVQTSLEEIASVDFYPSSLETFCQPESPCYAVLQSLDSNVGSGTRLDESHSGTNDGNVLYPPYFQPWRSSTVYENLEELGMPVPQQQTIGHRVSPIFAWHVCPTDIFSNQTSEALRNFDAVLTEEVEIFTPIDFGFINPTFD